MQRPLQFKLLTFAGTSCTNAMQGDPVTHLMLHKGLPALHLYTLLCSTTEQDFCVCNTSVYKCNAGRPCHSFDATQRSPNIAFVHISKHHQIFQSNGCSLISPYALTAATTPLHTSVGRYFKFIYNRERSSSIRSPQ